MPTKKDPNSIKVSSGLAGQGSTIFVPVVSVSQGGSSFPEAYQVKSNPPPNMDGTNVQENLDELHGLIPKRPNRLDEIHGNQYNNLNPVKAHTLDYVKVLYNDGSSSSNASDVFSLPTLEESFILAPLYPADRGVLALEIGGTHISAVNLDAIFYEGNVTFQDPDGKFSRQRNYVVDSSSPYYEGLVFNTQGQVEGDITGTLDQIQLILRVPVKESYDDFDSISGGGLIPVAFPDAFPNTFHSFQIAALLPTLDLGSPNVPATIRFIHYKTIEDLNKGEAGNPFESYAILDLAELLEDDMGGTPFIYDDQNTLNIESFSFEPSSTTSSSGITLSGVSYYGIGDDIQWDFEAQGLYNSTFVEDGAHLTYVSNDEVLDDSVSLHYTQYSPNGTTTSSISEGSTEEDVSFFFMEPRALKLSSATLTIENGNESFVTGSDSLLALVNSDSEANVIPTPSHEKSVKDYFTSEVSRYPHNAHPSSLILPDGSTSSWDSSTSLSDDDLQVGHIVTTNFGLGRGALFIPHIDYTNHIPDMSQPNYSIAGDSANNPNNPDFTQEDGDGSLGNPYQIWSAVQFNHIGTDSSFWDKHFILMADVNMNSIGSYNIIGNSSTPFSGSFNGNWKTITGLTIYEPTANDVGIFGYIDGASLSNIYSPWTAINVTGQNQVGGLVGTALNSTIYNCSIQALVSGNNEVGGLVGYSSDLTLERSIGAIALGNNRIGSGLGYAVNTDVFQCGGRGTSFGQNQVGGFVGFMVNGTLDETYSLLNVNGADDVGGLAGSLNQVTVTNSYVFGFIGGPVEGANKVGGFVGTSFDSSITDVYVRAFVEGTGTNVGPIWGENNSSPPLTNAYYNSDTDLIGNDNTDGTPLTSAQMALTSSFSGWVFFDSPDYVWGMSDLSGVPTPRLAWEFEPILPPPLPDFTGSRSYVRAFNAKGSQRVGTLKIISDTANLFNLFKYDGHPDFGGHSGGLEILIAPSGIEDQEWLDLGRFKGSGNGALLSVNPISAHEVDVRFELDNFPVEQNGFWPVAIKITVYGSSTAYNPSAFSIRQIEYHND